MHLQTCEICIKRKAKYICQECGRKVCQLCFRPATWFCLDCDGARKGETTALQSFQWSTPVKLFLLGFFLMFAGTIVVLTATIFSGTSVGAGTVIWIPPLPPIGFGAGPYAFWVILLGVASIIISSVLFVVLWKQSR